MNTILQEKIAMVTGATSGIGLATVRDLAKQGLRVVMVSRSHEKCESIISQIQKETGNSTIEFIASDLSVMANVRQVAQEFMRRHSRLDILVNNAGAIFFTRSRSRDGYEMTFALNHLSYFLLTNLLLGTLTSSAPSRIVNVSSEAHKGGKINFDDLMLERKYSGFGAYSASKLANILFTYQLADHLSGTQVTANALHPGLVSTGFGKNNGSFIKWAMEMYSLVALKPEKGAETSIFLASSPEVEGVSGRYFSDCKEIKSSPSSYDKVAQERLWEISMELTSNR